MTTSQPEGAQRSTSRRALLLGGAAALGTGTIGAAAVHLAGRTGNETTVSEGIAPTGSAAVVPFFGPHQGGIATLPAQAHVVFLALDLRPGSGLSDIRRLLRLLTDDAARLTAGQPPLGAEDPELPGLPSRLTVTLGFGSGLFDAAGKADQCPAVIRALPAFPTDRLQQRWSGGDLLVVVSSDDPMPVSYAVRRLVRDARSIATVRWVQRGFNQARGSEPPGTTTRNLLGQRDGSMNPSRPQDVADVVWSREGPGWMAGGSMLVLRRIRVDLDTWDDFGRAGKELVMARRLDTGAPVTGGGERDRPDTAKTDSLGLPVVDPSAHAVRATPRNPAERMLRRGYSFDDGPHADGTPDAGLLFAAYQADAATAFVPVQRRLAESDALNKWVTHVGSAAFAIPPGCVEGEFLGQSLIGA